MIAFNPENKQQAYLFYNMLSAYKLDEYCHPAIVMKELSEKFNFKIISAVPQTLFDGWSFWIEFENEIDLTDFPLFFQTQVEWKPIGQV